jgi:hypothetical protein
MQHAGEGSATRIFAAMSPDSGNTWQDAGFPAAATTLHLRYTDGVGACGSEDGKSVSLMFNEFNPDNPSQNDVHVVDGIVGDSSVAWASEVRAQAAAPGRVESAPSCVFLTGGSRIVAFRSGKQIVAQMYLPGVTQLIPTVLSPTGEGTDAEGRPALASPDHSKVVMAWRSGSPGHDCAQLFLAEGVPQQFGGFTLYDLSRKTGMLRLDALDPGEHKHCAASDPALGTDGRHYYVAIIQERRGRPLHGWDVIIYRSDRDDIYSGWSVLAAGWSGSVHHATHIGIAVEHVGWLPQLYPELVLAKVRNKSRGANEVGMWLSPSQDPGTTPWQDLGTAPWLGMSDASFRAIGLARFGKTYPILRRNEGETIVPTRRLREPVSRE